MVRGRGSGFYYKPLENVMPAIRWSGLPLRDLLWMERHPQPHPAVSGWVGVPCCLAVTSGRAGSAGREADLPRGDQ